jgi:ribosomal protein S27E
MQRQSESDGPQYAMECLAYRWKCEQCGRVCYDEAPRREMTCQVCGHATPVAGVHHASGASAEGGER